MPMFMPYNPFANKNYARVAVGGVISAVREITKTVSKSSPQTQQNMVYKAGKSYTRTKKTTKKGKAKTMSMSKMILAEKPAKHYMYQQAQTLTKGAVYTFSPTQNVVRGTADNQRIGDTINMIALKWSGYYATASTASSYQIRVIVGYTGEEFTASTLATGGYGSSEIFQSSTAGIFTTNGIINPKAFTTIYDQKMVVNSVIAAVSDAVPLDGSVKLSNQKFLYQADGSVYGKTRNLVFIVCADDLLASAAANAGGVTISFDFIFK